LYNKSGFVQPDDLAAMGLRTRERAAYRSFEVPLTEVPQVTVQTFTGCVLEFKVTNNSGKYSKPPGITHLEIRYHIGDNPPEFSEDYRGLYLSSKCRFLLQLDAGMSMNKIYITTRWIARNGHFLPFSIPKVSFVL
jgi:hypothetical protein